MKHELKSPTQAAGLLRKLAAVVVSLGVVGLVLVFSVVVFAIITVVGAIVWGYLWWKSRELRKQMRDFQSQATERERQASDDGVFEGEVIRVVDAQDGR